MSPLLADICKLPPTLSLPPSFHHLLAYQSGLLSILFHLESFSAKSIKRHLATLTQDTGKNDLIPSTFLSDLQFLLRSNSTFPSLFFLPFLPLRPPFFIPPAVLAGFLEFRRGNFERVLAICASMRFPASSSSNSSNSSSVYTMFGPLFSSSSSSSSNIRQFSSQACVHSLLGSSEFALGHVHKAVFHYLAIEPRELRHPEFIDKILGIFCISLNRPKIALQYLERATHSLAQHPSVWFYYALALFHVNETKTRSLALLSLENCLKNASKKDVEWEFWARLLRALIFESMGKTRKVIEEAEKAEQIQMEVSTFPRCSVESKQFVEILKAESYLQLEQFDVAFDRPIK